MLKKAINFMKNYKLSNFNFRLFIYVLAVTAVGIYAIGNAAEAEAISLTNYRFSIKFGSAYNIHAYKLQVCI